jgi:hypothetical protein
MKKNKRKNKKSKINNPNKLVTIIAIGIVVLTFAILVIKNIDHHILKSEYAINELGYLDKIEVTLKNVTYINQETGIELAFEITNKTDNTITIVPDEYFKFFDINEVQIPNKFDNNKSIIKKNQTITYRLQYDVTKKELYEIYFYSQVVENNIKFSFSSSDIDTNPVERTNPKQDILESDK